MTLLRLTVAGLPPKKDGASSMWRKPSEVERLRALRLAAFGAVGEHFVPLAEPVGLALRLFAPVHAGDLDNFITGICDGLMAAHSGTPIAVELWEDVPAGARPDRAIVLADDRWVTRIQAERLQPESEGPRYEVTLSRLA